MSLKNTDLSTAEIEELETLLKGLEMNLMKARAENKELRAELHQYQKKEALNKLMDEPMGEEANLKVLKKKLKELEQQHASQLKELKDKNRADFTSLHQQLKVLKNQQEMLSECLEFQIGAINGKNHIISELMRVNDKLTSQLNEFSNFDNVLKDLEAKIK